MSPRFGISRPAAVSLVAHAAGCLAMVLAAASYAGREDLEGIAYLMISLRAILACPTVIAWALASRRYAVARKWVLGLDTIGATAILLLIPVEELLRLLRLESLPLVILGVAAVFCYIAIFIVGLCLLALRLHQIPGKLWAAVRAVSLHPALKARGYDWLTLAQAGELWELCGEAAFRLPSWEEVGILPGMAEGNLQALARMAATAPGPLKVGR